MSRHEFTVLALESSPELTWTLVHLVRPAVTQTRWEILLMKLLLYSLKNERYWFKTRRSLERVGWRLRTQLDLERMPYQQGGINMPVLAPRTNLPILEIRSFSPNSVIVGHYNPWPGDKFFRTMAQTPNIPYTDRQHGLRFFLLTLIRMLRRFHIRDLLEQEQFGRAIALPLAATSRSIGRLLARPAPTSGDQTRMRQCAHWPIRMVDAHQHADRAPFPGLMRLRYVCDDCGHESFTEDYLILHRNLSHAEGPHQFL